MDNIFWLMASTVFVVVLVVIATMAMARYKRCPSDKIMVIFGKIGHGQTARCIHGGAAFVWPVIQDYAFLDLIPMQIEVDLDNALSKQNIRVSVPSNFTVGISTKPDVMVAAAERLLGMHQDAIKNLARDMIIGQLRLVVATMDIEEINADRDKFLVNIYKNVEMELEKIGLRLINVNIKDLQDESGYLSSLGKKAAADALNKAKKDVAEKDRDGAIGEAEAKKEQTVRVAQAQAQSASGQAEAQQMQRVNVANANARAVEGENKASVDIANSTSDMRQQKAEAERSAAAAEKVKSAQALQESYEAEKVAEQRRAERDYASQNADVVVRTRIEKEKKVIEAEAEAARIQKIAEGEASRIKQIAEGEAAAIYVKMEAQARGLQEILTKQAQGLERIVKAAGDNPDKAATLLIIDKLPELVKTQVEAIKNLKIDKVVVWDNGAGDGKSSTANFLSSLIGSVPPLNNLFNMAGMKLPEVLGKDLKDCAHEKAGGEPQAGSKG